MTILTDGTHLASDKSHAELREFADNIGLHRRFYHSGSRHPHYDLPRGSRDREIPGARTMTTRDLVRILRGSKVRPDNSELGTTRRRRSTMSTCYVCGANARGGKYIHHQPGHEDIFQGGMACLACTPGEVAKLVAAGELIPVLVVHDTLIVEKPKRKVRA